MTTTVDAIKALFKANGCEVIMPPANTKGYTFETKKGGDCVAVLVTEHRARDTVAHVEKFQEYLGLPIANRFSAGYLISASGFTKPAITHAQTEGPANLGLSTYSAGKLIWNYRPPGGVLIGEDDGAEESGEHDVQPRYFGVFTCKGGVGKTTVAAHLAGAFALMGFDVVLLDLDPDRNLRRLFLRDPQDENGDASLYVPGKGNQLGTTITVLDHKQWKVEHNPEVKIIVCDCSPVLSENPKDVVAKFDYCIIPTILSPLSIAKRADVITRTFKGIREMNQKAEMFALINGYDMDAATARPSALLKELKKEIDKYTSEDKKCKFIHPEDAKIRYSSALFYWGMHIVEKRKPQLAFQETFGKSYPRVDFLQLAEYLEHHTDIDALKKERV
jgi:chromosome partitioning protein